MEGQILEEGLLSEITPQLTVEAPVTVGAYTVRADFYPFAPPAGTSWNFSSPVYQETLLYVSNEIKVDDPNFQNSEVFFHLFHFQGEYSDWASGDPVQVLASREDPALDVYRGVFGYRMDLFSGFDGVDFPFPVTVSGRLEPFSLVFSLAVIDALPGGTIFKAENSGGDFSMIFRLGREGTPEVEFILGNDDPIRLDHSEVWEPGFYPSVTVSVVPDYTEGKIYFLLYRGGELLASGEKDWFGEGLNTQGSFSLGGEDGAAIILDEFGIYFRDEQGRPSPSAGMFPSDRLKEYGHRLLFADGFDSPHLHDGVEVSEEFRLRFSRLELSPQGLFLSPPLTGALQSFTGFASLETGNEEGSSVLLQLWGIQEESLILVAETVPAPGASVSWTYTVGQDDPLFNGAALSRETLEGVSSLRIGIKNGGEKPLFLHDVTVLKENLRLTGQTDTSKDELLSVEESRAEILPDNPA
jgi:hypothetical protein